MHILKIEKIGDSLGITLPPEVLQELKVIEGDTVFLKKTEEGVQLITAAPIFEKTMKAYQKVSEKYKNALRELAK